MLSPLCDHLTHKVIIAFNCNSLTTGTMDRIGRCSDSSICLGLRAATICTSHKKLKFLQSIPIKKFRLQRFAYIMRLVVWCVNKGKYSPRLGLPQNQSHLYSKVLYTLFFHSSLSYGQPAHPQRDKGGNHPTL